MSTTNLEVVKDKDTQFITCSNCRANLMRIHSHSAGKTELYKMVVKCPFCNDKSFAFSVTGPLRYLPADNVQLLNCEEKGTTMYFNTKRK